MSFLHEKMFIVVFFFFFCRGGENTWSVAIEVALAQRHWIDGVLFKCFEPFFFSNQKQNGVKLLSQGRFEFNWWRHRCKVKPIFDVFNWLTKQKMAVVRHREISHHHYTPVEKICFYSYFPLTFCLDESKREKRRSQRNYCNDNDVFVTT